MCGCVQNKKLKQIALPQAHAISSTDMNVNILHVLNNCTHTLTLSISLLFGSLCSSVSLSLFRSFDLLFFFFAIQLLWKYWNCTGPKA